MIFRYILIISLLCVSIFANNIKIDINKVELGKLLFFDKRLFISQKISCGTCHQPKKGWADSNAKAIGADGLQGTKNVPTLINVAQQMSFHWDGSISSLQEQALKPIIALSKVDMPIKRIIKRLSSIKGYQDIFNKIYPNEGLTPDSLANALTSFERTIISNNTLYDKWIRGDKNIVYPKEAIEGFELFKGKGKCSSCHGGSNFSYGNFENVGLGDCDSNATQEEKKSIWYGAFKVPTLREAEKTAPYFHDGSVHTLEESVHICGNAGRFKDARRSPFLRDRNITMAEMYKIVAFIKTLSTEEDNFIEPTHFPK